ncbi:hypothetical protein BC826DRAFT_1111962 [Russula brevipes]|nr:hypothetical protein BC826DRAFT_1111962 [Russula brevipes]
MFMRPFITSDAATTASDFNSNTLTAPQEQDTITNTVTSTNTDTAVTPQVQNTANTDTSATPQAQNIVNTAAPQAQDTDNTDITRLQDISTIAALDSTIDPALSTALKNQDVTLTWTTSSSSSSTLRKSVPHQPSTCNLSRKLVTSLLETDGAGESKHKATTSLSCRPTNATRRCVKPMTTQVTKASIRLSAPFSTASGGQHSRKTSRLYPDMPRMPASPDHQDSPPTHRSHSCASNIWSKHAQAVPSPPGPSGVHTVSKLDARSPPSSWSRMVRSSHGTS